MIFVAGLLELRIPAITSIYTESIEVTVEDLLLLSSPVVDRQYDAARDEALKQARKRDTLEKLEQLLQQGRPTGDIVPKVKNDGR